MDCPQTETLNQPGLFERLKAGGKRVPLSGSLEVTFRCNLRCVHCYLGDKRSGAPGQPELTKAEMCGILDQVTDAGTLWLLLTGGEPFLRPDFLDIYRYAAHKGLIVTIFSNGTLLTPRIADELGELPPFLMEITLYGATEATYERVSGVKGSYARCMQGIELLMERNIPLKLKTIVMQWNKHEYEAIRAFASRLSVGFRHDPLLVGAMDGGQGAFPQRLAPEEVVALEQCNPALITELRALHERTHPLPPPATLYPCGAALYSYHIDPSGMLSPCILSRAQNYPVLRGSFAHGWETFLPGVRSQPAQPRPQCAGCGLANLCAQCPGKSHLEHGMLDEPVEYFCRIGRLRAEAIGAITVS